MGDQPNSHELFIMTHENRFNNLETEQREYRKVMFEMQSIMDEANSRSKSNMKRLDSLDDLVKIMHETNTNVQLLGTKVGDLVSTNVNLLKVQEKQGNKITKLENKPGVTILKVFKWIMVTIGALFIGMLFSIWQATLVSQYIK